MQSNHEPRNVSDFRFCKQLGQLASQVQQHCSYVPPVKSQETEKSIDAQFYLVGHGDQHKCQLVASVVLHEGSSPCLISLKLAMELDSLW